MKKALIVALCSTPLVLAACGGTDETEDQPENTNGLELTETSAEESGDMTAETVLEEAIALFDGIDSLHVERQGSLNQEIETPDVNEEISDGSMDMFTSEKQWHFQEEEDFYQRTEMSMTMMVNEDGDEEQEETMPTSYSFTDQDDPTSMISYEEGEDEAIRYENPTNEESLSFGRHGYQYEALLENAELTLLGEETINGYDTYHIEANEDGAITEYWFDKDTFFEISRTLEASSESEEDEFRNEGSGYDTVIDYEINIDFDESLFEAPDSINVIDGNLEDTLG